MKFDKIHLASSYLKTLVGESVMILHVREHDNLRVRIWDEEMRGYGQFNLVDKNWIVIFKSIIDVIGVVEIMVHHCDDFVCSCEKCPMGDIEW